MKKTYIAKRYWKDKSTPMGKVDALAKKYNNVIDLSLGDPDVITHSDIIDYAFEQAKLGHTKYTDFRGDPELRKAILEYYREDFSVTLKDEEVMVTASACLGMYLALETILDPGDEVIIHAPYFTPYYQQIELAQGVPVEINTFEEDGFQINIDALKQKITARTKAIIINTPNNPTGAVFSKKTLSSIIDVVIANDLVIIADEIYGAYTFTEQFISLATFEKIKDRTIVINSFSKDFTMTGWRIGHIIAPKEIIKTCQIINENVVFTAPSISQRAAIYALKHRKRIQKTFVDEYKSRVFYAYERIKRIPWMKTLPPQGTFYLFINIKNTRLTAEQVSEKILDQAQVLTIPGNSFGKCGEDYIRIACTVDKDALKKAFDRIAAIEF